MARWTFTDDSVGDTYVMEVNPNQGGTMRIKKTLTESRPPGPNAPVIMFEGRDEPQTSTISGIALTRNQVVALETWDDKKVQIKITDDLGRDTWVRLGGLALTRAPSRRYPWRHRFQIQVSELDWQ